MLYPIFSCAEEGNRDPFRTNVLTWAHRTLAVGNQTVAKNLDNFPHWDRRLTALLQEGGNNTDANYLSKLSLMRNRLVYATSSYHFGWAC